MTHDIAATGTIEPAGLWEAVVMDASPDGAVTVRDAAPTAVGSELPVTARNACAGYLPAAGDRVLVQSDDARGARYVIGVLHAAMPSVRTATGVTARVDGERVVVSQPDGTVVVEFDGRTGRATVRAPGDLALAAPAGRITLQAATDVCIEAGRRVVHRAKGDDGARSELRVESKGATLEAPSLDVRVTRATGDIDEGTLRAKTLRTTAEKVVQVVDAWELRADQVREQARSVYRDVEGLLQTRAERVRTVVSDTLHMVAKRTRIRSKEDTSVDGRRVLLG